MTPDLKEWVKDGWPPRVIVPGPPETPSLLAELAYWHKYMIDVAFKPAVIAGILFLAIGLLGRSLYDMWADGVSFSWAVRRYILFPVWIALVFYALYVYGITYHVLYLKFTVHNYQQLIEQREQKGEYHNKHTPTSCHVSYMPDLPRHLRIRARCLAVLLAAIPLGFALLIRSWVPSFE